MKRGPKPKEKVKIKWSANFAYAIGLLVTDGCLSKDCRHIDFTSAEIEQIKNFLNALRIEVNIGKKHNYQKNSAYRIQFSDVSFYHFLQSIGLTEKKSFTIGKINIPENLFFDFLRGCFDGDGCSYSYWDLRWKSSFMFYVSFASSSIKFINWLREEVDRRLNIKSHIGTSIGGINPSYQLRYSKYAAIKLVKKMYQGNNKIYLKRKKLKINKSLGTIGLERI
jgi:hypothetical protein